MGLFGSGRAPGRPGEPFRAIQGAHDTGANPNETRVSFVEVNILCSNLSETSLHSCHLRLGASSRRLLLDGPTTPISLYFVVLSSVLRVVPTAAGGVPTLP